MVAPAIIGAGVQLLGGLFGSRSARRAARREQQRADEAAAAQRAYATAATQRAEELAGLAPRPTAQTFRPVNLTTGYGTTRYNPETGQYEQQLSDPLAGQQRFSYESSQALANQLKGFDPQAFAQQRFAGYQSLLTPQREAATSRLLGQLKRKGLLGFEQTPVGGTSTQRYNPLTEGFARAMAQQDEALALKAFGEGTAEQERLAALQERMFGQGMRLNEPLTSQMRYGYDLGERDYRRIADAEAREFQQRERMFALTEPFRRQMELGGLEAQAQAGTLANQQRLAASQGLTRGMMDIGGRFFGGSQVPQSGMFGSYFGTTPTAGVSSEVSRLGSSTMNPFSDYYTGRGGFGFYGE